MNLVGRVALIFIVLLIRRSIPYSDRQDLFTTKITTKITIDSIWSIGPTAGIYDKDSKKYYWFKSYTTLNQRKLDTLKSRTARIRYMKFLLGPLENRIFYMEVDSIVVLDQVVERE